MIKLSNRLAAIASLVPLKSSVIDIGCDHALLDIYLYQNKQVEKIIASDINENALNNAKEKGIASSASYKGNEVNAMVEEDR